MAKGRKLTSSRSEQYLGSFGNYSQCQGSGTGASELIEEDVWSVIDVAVNGDDHGDWGNRSFSSYPPPRSSDHHQFGGLSLAFDDSSNSSSQRIVNQMREGVAEPPRGRHIATSAPVNVPYWSKIYRVNTVELLHDSNEGLNDTEIVPPHEYLAREHARSRKIAANSVFEGVGRTLKGRDMSRVRDAVWSQTGFDG